MTTCYETTTHMTRTDESVKSEGEPCLVICFEVYQKENCMSQIIKCDIISCYNIKSLKEDNEKLFNIPSEDQVWTFNGAELNDDMSLMEFIDSYGETHVPIVVKRVKYT